MKLVKFSETMTRIASCNSSQNKTYVMSAPVAETSLTTRKQTRSAHWQINSTVKHVRPKAKKPEHGPIIQRSMLKEDKLQSLANGVKIKTKMIKMMEKTPQGTNAAHLAMNKL